MFFAKNRDLSDQQDFLTRNESFHLLLSTAVMSSGPLVFIHRTADEPTAKVISQGIYDDSFYWETIHRSPEAGQSAVSTSGHAVTGSNAAISTTASPLTSAYTARRTSLSTSSSQQPPLVTTAAAAQKVTQQRVLYDHPQPPSSTASSELICDLSANDLLSSDWTSASAHCGHSDPNLRNIKDLGYPTMSFNNLSITKPGAARRDLWTENNFTVLPPFTEVASNCSQSVVSSNSFSMIPFNNNNTSYQHPELCQNQQLTRPSAGFFSKQRPRDKSITVTTQPPPVPALGVGPKSAIFFPHPTVNNDLVADFFVPENLIDTAANSSSTATIVNNRNGFLPNNSDVNTTNYPFYVGTSPMVDTIIDYQWHQGLTVNVGDVSTGGFASTTGKKPSGRMDSVNSVAPPASGSTNTNDGGCATTESGGTGSGTVTSGAQQVSTGRRSNVSDRMGLVKQVRPSSDTNVISLTDNPGAPMLKADSTLSLDTESRARACCFCWCCCCSCSCIQVPPGIDSVKRSNQSIEDQHRTETQILEPRTSYDDLQSWAESFDNLMRCFTTPDGMVGQRAFRDFLRSEYSEENILFWLACEDLKRETCPEIIEEKARIIYENYISILSPKEVSLDSRVRDIINNNMTEPTPHTFDEAQIQIYTLMQRDSYPRFLNSRVYKDLLAMAKCESTKPPC
ncbi:Regulator of G-protein signaling 20 [Sparganum proliferum]